MLLITRKSNMDTFIDIKNEDVVKIPPMLLTHDLKTNVLHALQRKYEGICSKFGYIKQGSIRDIVLNNGQIETSTFHGYVNFDVTFVSQICNPPINSVVRCVVRNVNSFGILCAAGYNEGGTLHNILNVVVPKQNYNGDGDYFAMIDKVNINDYINVEILGKKYILNNKNINVFGKMVDMGEVDVNNQSLDSDECSRNGLVEDCDSENEDVVSNDIEDDDNGEENDHDANSVSDLDNTSAVGEFNLNADDDLSDIDNTSDIDDDV